MSEGERKGAKARRRSEDNRLGFASLRRGDFALSELCVHGQGARAEESLPMRGWKRTAAALLTALAAGTARAAPATEGRMHNLFVINEDDSHFYGTREPEQMTLAGLHAFVDQYAGTAVTHLFLCPNAMRASFRSRTREAIWDPVDGKEPTDRWPANAMRLFEAGLDPYAVWIARCREKGLSPWLSMRMNDLHNADDTTNYLHSSFWRLHPQFWRVPGGSGSPWTNRALNYVHPEVRRHQMDFVEELLERYDPDGLELDWMRFGYHLTPGREREEAPVLTEFVRQVRSRVDAWSARRGRRILLGARVPTHPDAAAGLGMDGVLWAREGLVDMLVPSPFWSSSDFDIPVELWRERLGDAWARVTVAPGLEYNARPWPGGEAVANDVECARGFAAACRHRGADSLYLFNWMDSETRPVSGDQYARLLREGLGMERVCTAPRRHPVCYRDTVPAGFPNGVCLPVEAPAGGAFRVFTGPRPASGKVWAVAGLAARDGVAQATLEGTLNGFPLGPCGDEGNPARLGGRPARALRLECPLPAVADGLNELVLRQPAGQPSQQIVWVEMRFEP